MAHYNGIDFDHRDLFLDPVLSLIQINENEEFIAELESIEQLLQPPVTTDEKLKCKTKQKLEKKKKKKGKGENILTEISRLREEVSTQKLKNQILQNELNSKREKNKRLELLYKELHIISKNVTENSATTDILDLV